MANITLYKTPRTEELLRLMPDVKPSQLFRDAVEREAKNRGLA